MLAGCGGGGSSTRSSTPTAAPTQSTATAPPPTATTQPTTPTTSTQTGAAAPTISQVQAKVAARAAAVRAAARGGIRIPAGQWDVRCTAVGGRDRSGTWRCQVASLSGQCSGTITAYAAGTGLARTRDVRVACGQ
jgi:pyruvate/2-oxoglutarate dehydrogenase complex dihydrolipoamide acyltransferase (E2) component